MMCYSVFANANMMLKFLFQIVLRQNDPEVLAKNTKKLGQICKSMQTSGK